LVLSALAFLDEPGRQRLDPENMAAAPSSDRACFSGPEEKGVKKKPVRVI